jgi:Zn-dependent protease with chaperone function
MKAAKKVVAMVLAALLFFQGSLAAGSLVERSQAPEDESVAGPLNSAEAYASAPPLEEIVKMSSWDIAIIAERFNYDLQTIKLRTDSLKSEFKRSEDAFNAKAKAIEKQIERKERELETLPQSTTDPDIAAQRVKIQCEIQNAKKDVTNLGFEYLQNQITTDVQIAKLNLLVGWFPSLREIKQQIDGGTLGQRRYGNVLDIGNRATRDPFKGQQDDVKWGREEIEAARQRNVLPQQVEDAVVTEYINRLAANLARNSDLQTPLNVQVVQQVLRKDGKPVPDKDGKPQQVANAMALPGGFLYVYAGIILDAENESELAGVIAHEISHNAARHAHRLQDKGTTFGIIQLATLIGLQVFAPGLFQAASSLGYLLKGLLLQGIFDGLGIVFTVNALGVSRDFELEADQLGMQYAWKTGYDPRGFLQLFDRMSQKEGYASHTSFFATHPAFGDRTLNALKEYKALQSLGESRHFVFDTSEFQQIKNRLKDNLKESWEKQKATPDKPTLQRPEPKECPPFSSFRFVPHAVIELQAVQAVAGVQERLSAFSRDNKDQIVDTKLRHQGEKP